MRLFEVTYCGYNIHNPDKDTILRPHGLGAYLFLVLNQPMNFHNVYASGDPLLHETITAQGGDCILYTPKYPEHYSAPHSFSNSFVHFNPITSREDTIDDFLGNHSIPLNTIFHPQNLDNLNHLLKQIYYEYLSKEIHSPQMLDLLVKELLIELDRNLVLNENFTEFTEMHENLQTVRLQMLSRPQKDWTIDDLCDLAHIGKSQFHVYYKKFFHTTPKEDLIAARIDRAKYLLSNNNLRINEVALQCGFNNIYHFTRYFKKVCKVTPSEYAKRH